MEKTKFKLTDQGHEKSFTVTKMDALKAANWSLSLASIGFNAFGQENMDWSTDAILKALAQLDSPKASELRRQLRETVSVVTSIGEFPLDDAMLVQHIQEFQNVFLIEAEAFKANFGFFIAGGGLKSLIGSLTNMIHSGSTPQVS